MEQGWLLRTGIRAGGRLKEALRKGQRVLDPFCPTQKDPRKGQQLQSGADSSVLPGRVPWSRREKEEEKLSCNCQDPATHAAARKAMAPLPLRARENKSRACLVWSQSLVSSSRSSLLGSLRGSPGQSCALFV